MLPKLDSVEWSTWGVGEKLDALNEAIQSIIICLGDTGKSEEIKDAREDGKKAELKRQKGFKGKKGSPTFGTMIPAGDPPEERQCQVET